MTTTFSISATPFIFAGFSTLIGFSILTNSFKSTGFVPFSHVSLLITQDITKPFFIRKLIIVANHKTALIYTQTLI